MDCWRHVARLAVQCASILPVGQAFGLRLVVMSWQLERKLLTASGVLQAFQDLQQFSRLSTFQGMFLDIVIYCIYIFYSLLLCLLHICAGRFSNPITLTSVSNAAINTYRLGWGWKLSAPPNLIFRQLQVRCMPCGTKAVDGWIHLLRGLFGPQRIQWWSNMMKCACSIEWCCSLFLYVLGKNRCQDSIHFSSFSSASPSHPAFARKT